MNLEQVQKGEYDKQTEVQTNETEPGREHGFSLPRLTQLVWWFFGILEALLALRVIF